MKIIALPLVMVALLLAFLLKKRIKDAIREHIDKRVRTLFLWRAIALFNSERLTPSNFSRNS